MKYKYWLISPKRFASFYSKLILTEFSLYSAWNTTDMGIVFKKLVTRISANLFVIRMPWNKSLGKNSWREFSLLLLSSFFFFFFSFFFFFFFWISALIAHRCLRQVFHGPLIKLNTFFFIFFVFFSSGITYF